ncbi:MAG: hypothetical protein JSR70_07570 [Proteobacteria bacterium]|nr:hypothetical protein [Pseudomonadota bacterium]
MHGKVAAGKVTDLVFDDDAKAIKISGVVVDLAERAKMASGVYTGVSIGGSYVGKQWPDDVVKGAMRYTANPSEISIVDNPCNGSAHFTVVKADGASIERPLGVTKSLYAVSRMADLTAALADFQNYLEFEAQAEEDQDDDGFAAEVKESVKALASILERYTAKEAQEVAQDVERSASATVTKTSEEDTMNEELQKAHDSALAKVADLEKQVADLTAAAAEKDDLIVKAAANAEAEAAKQAELQKAIDALKAMPEPVKAAARAVEKADDGHPDPVADLAKAIDAMEDGEEKALALIKLAQLSPVH